MNEFERIAAIEARLGRMDWDIATGLGDDAAVLKPLGAATALSVDTSVEGVHFQRAFASWGQIGRRAMITALSDLAAMSATPRASLVALILPASFDDESFLELVEGIGEAADETGAHVIGGNMSSGCEVSITVTVIGTLAKDPPLRSQAKVGDGVYVSGPLGARALGLALLQRGMGDDTDPEVEDFIHRWRHPDSKLNLGRKLAGLAHAMIDISDGLVQDLGHLCEASDVGAVLQWSDVPRALGFDAVCARIDADPVALALGGGEDYELLFTAEPGEHVEAFGTRIGTIVEGGAVTVLDEAGTLIQTGGGYTHFAT